MSLYIVDQWYTAINVWRDTFIWKGLVRGLITITIWDDGIFEQEEYVYFDLKHLLEYSKASCSYLVVLKELLSNTSNVIK